MANPTVPYIVLAKEDKAARSINFESKLREEETDALRKEKEVLEFEKTAVQEHKKRAEEEFKKMQAESVKLNVSGKMFQLSLSTIMKYPRSTLG